MQDSEKKKKKTAAKRIRAKNFGAKKIVKVSVKGSCCVRLRCKMGGGSGRSSNKESNTPHKNVGKTPKEP